MADVVDLMLMAASREPHRQAAIAHYHNLLEKCDINEFAQGLQDDLRQKEVFFGDRVLCPFLRPHFIGREQFLLLQDAIRGVTRAIKALNPLLMNSEEVRELLGFTEEEKKLIEIDPGYDELSVSSRLDSFLSGGTLQFVEYNAETPAGIAYADKMARAFMQTEVMKDFMRKFPCQPMFVSDRLLQSLLDTYEEWGGKERPTIGIIDYEGLPTIHEFNILREHFMRSGYKCLIADPRKLEYKDGVLSFEGEKIHIFYKRLLINEYLEHFDECPAVWEAYKDHAACFVNSFRCKYLHKKAIFAILTDPRFQKGLTDTQIQAIYTHVPWTRMLRDVKTTAPDGTVIELLKWVRENRNNLIMKPNDDYGGHGIIVGWESDEATWENAIQDCLKLDYLVQVKVNVAREHYPSWNGKEVEIGEYAVDLDPYIFNHRAYGFMTRLSGTALCNVTSGGGSTATFMLD